MTLPSLSPFRAPPDAYVRFRTAQRFSSLDGLRALSVIAVIWHHTAGDKLESHWAAAGHHGVTMFFAISGFLITTLLLREQQDHGFIDLRAFYVRRALRIFPLYYAVLGIYTLLVFLLERGSEPGQAFFRNLVYFLTYTSNWFVDLNGRVIFYFSWSLAAEEQFYLVWPPLLILLNDHKRSLTATALLISVLVLFDHFGHLLGSHSAIEAARVALNKIPLAIVGGVTLALLLHNPKVFARLWPLLAATRWHGAIWTGLALLAVTHARASWSVQSLSLALAVASCCIREDTPIVRILRARPLAYIGTISYGMYLLHMLCKNAVNKTNDILGLSTGPLLVFALTLLLSIVIATVTFRFYESIFLRMKLPFQRSGAIQGK